MAERALFQFPRVGATAEQRKGAEQHRRRDLRIAIRQLERAELYLVALYSLDLGDGGVDQAVDDLIGDVRGLRQGLSRRGFAGRPPPTDEIDCGS